MFTKSSFIHIMVTSSNDYTSFHLTFIKNISASSILTYKNVLIYKNSQAKYHLRNHKCEVLCSADYIDTIHR